MIRQTRTYETSAERGRREERERVEAARKAQEEKEATDRARLIATPDQFLETSNLVYHDEGIINDYRTLTKVTILNKSRFPVHKLSGEIDWFDGARKIGSMPLTLTGSVPAGDTKTFASSDGTLQNGTLQGKATAAKIRFTNVAIVGSK